jgi:hypothetical protein
MDITEKAKRIAVLHAAGELDEAALLREGLGNADAVQLQAMDAALVVFLRVKADDIPDGFEDLMPDEYVPAAWSVVELECQRLIEGCAAETRAAA